MNYAVFSLADNHPHIPPLRHFCFYEIWSFHSGKNVVCDLWVVSSFSIEVAANISEDHATSIFYPACESNMFLQNAGNYLQNYTAR